MPRCPACGSVDIFRAQCLNCGHTLPASFVAPADPPREAPKKRGRPRKHPEGYDRSREWKKARERAMGAENRTQVLYYIPAELKVTVEALARKWKVTKSAAATRLITEALEKYKGHIFTEEG